MFGLSAEDWRIVNQLVIEPLSTQHHAQVWVFGSRARGQERPFSDLDLLIDPQEPLEPTLLGEIRAALEESELPIKVDLVELDTLAEAYRNQALAERVRVS